MTLTKEMFEGVLDNVSVEITDDSIIETGNVNDQDYRLTIDLSKWAHYTTPNDMVQLSRLFWQSYPKMYERFSDITNAPFEVILAIEDEGYPIAEAGGDLVHLHDEWLYNNPGDYDCIAHELGHIAQDGSGWDDNFLEYSEYVELLADVCRMEYPLDGGYYNDAVWTMQNVYKQDTRETSVRFLVWLDYFYSTKDNDLMHKFCEICYDQRYTVDQWDMAWQELFSGTELEGMTIDEVWDMYASSDFSYLSTHAEKGEVSELLQKYDIRGKL